MDDREQMKNQSIAEFFAGRSIFITGGSGFIGKVLIEKLLRSCPDLKELFVLMRPKKGLSVDERLKKILTSPLYEKLREINPSYMDKVIPISGDVIEKDLGISSADRQMLIDRVSLIYHVAANVRFDDTLRNAIFTNTRSTRDICILGESMKKLVALVHISSTYALADTYVVEETVYPAEIDWRDAIEIAENIDNEILKTLTAKYMGTVPNTYTFTKRLAESVISDYSDRLPCAILRPSIVIPIKDDPIPGWLDNFNGPVGLMIGGGKGLLRIIYANPETKSDYMPVDVVVKSMIINTYERAKTTVAENPTPYVCNCSTNQVKHITMQELVELGLNICQDCPLNGLWYPNTVLTKSSVYFYMNVLIFHVLPALLVDQILKITGNKPILLKLQRRIYVANVSVSYFLQHDWVFRNNKLLSLVNDMRPVDRKEFFIDYFHVNVRGYFEVSIKGAKRFLLNEDTDNLEEAKKGYNRLWWLDRICKCLFYALFFWILYSCGFFSAVNRVVYKTYKNT